MLIALVAIGFVLLYKATGVVNFAHGDLVTLSAYVAFWTITDLGLPTIVGYLVTLVLMFFVGILVERVAYAPLRKRSILIVVISTLAAALGIRALIALWQGSTPKSVPSPVGHGTIGILGANIAQQRLVIIVVAVAVIGGLLVVFQKTSVGRQVRAMASDAEMSQLTGVRERLVSSLAFGVSATLAGLAGILIAPLIAIDLDFGFGLMITAFAAAILGGFGNLKGVLAGGLVIGLIQYLLGGYVLESYADTLPFIVLFAVIAFRPQGLFASAGRSRL